MLNHGVTRMYLRLKALFRNIFAKAKIIKVHKNMVITYLTTPIR